MKKYILQICLPIFIILTFQSCFIIKIKQNNEIRVEYDAVKSTKRLTKNFYYYRPLEKRTPLYSVKQTILKEIKPEEEITYTVFDNLRMSPQAHNLENQMFLILGNEIIPIDIKEIQIENSSNITEETGTILAADSTTVSVVTGYSQQNSKHYKISYQLTTDIIGKISRADEVLFRYYCGPNMITTALRESKLNRLKEMIVMR